MREIRGKSEMENQRAEYPVSNTLRAGLLNCLNARSRGLTFRHRASCIQGVTGGTYQTSGGCSLC